MRALFDLQREKYINPITSVSLGASAKKMLGKKNSQEK